MTAPLKRLAYNAEFKLNAISHAEKHGNRAASREFNVHESMVRKWRKQQDDLRRAKKTKKSFRGNHARWIQLEEDLAQWVVEERKASNRVTSVTIRKKATVLARELNISGFKGGPSWCDRFMRRRNLSARKPQVNQYVVLAGVSHRIPRCTSCCTKYHCPLCPLLESMTYKEIQAHWEVHKRNSTIFDDKRLSECNLACRTEPHYHCPTCYKAVTKNTMESHLQTCSPSHVQPQPLPCPVFPMPPFLTAPQPPSSSPALCTFILSPGSTSAPCGEMEEARNHPIDETSRDASSPHVHNEWEFERLKMETDADREFLHPASPGFEIKKETHDEGYEIPPTIPPEIPPVSDVLSVNHVNVSKSNGTERVSSPPTHSSSRTDLEMAVLRRQERVLQLQEEYYSLMIKYLKDYMSKDSGPGEKQDCFL